MIYEVRTYTLKVGATEEFEERFLAGLEVRQKYSPLGAFWRTEFGPLNQVIHVWPYEDLGERARIREAAVKDPSRKWPPKNMDLIDTQEVEVFFPAPFMRPLGSRDFGSGNIYEMRSYQYRPGAIPEVLKRWQEAIPHREEYSPLVACWYTEFGTLNKFVHVWVYKDFSERMRVFHEARKDPHWPPPTREWMLRQENKVMTGASFSPLK